MQKIIQSFNFDLDNNVTNTANKKYFDNCSMHMHVLTFQWPRKRRLVSIWVKTLAGVIFKF